jgi:non-heme chloroperoxidase
MGRLLRPTEHNPTRAERLMSIEQKHTQRADGTKISYRVMGPQDGAPVLLIHGWMTSGAVWDACLGSLDAGYRVVIPDLRGAGSELPADGYSHEGFAQDALACLDAESIGDAAVVGHSMGGQIAQWIGAEYPQRVRALALINTVPASGMALPPEADGLFFNSGGSRELQGTILGLATKQLDAEAKERLLDVAGALAPENIQQVYRLWSGASFADKLGQITAPTLVVATDDPLLPPAFLTQAVVEPIKRARLVYLPGPGHYPQVERPAESAALLNAFLAGAIA